MQKEAVNWLTGVESVLKKVGVVQAEGEAEVEVEFEVVEQVEVEVEYTQVAGVLPFDPFDQPSCQPVASLIVVY